MVLNWVDYHYVFALYQIGLIWCRKAINKIPTVNVKVAGTPTQNVLIILFLLLMLIFFFFVMKFHLQVHTVNHKRGSKMVNLKCHWCGCRCYRPFTSCWQPMTLVMHVYRKMNKNWCTFRYHCNSCTNLPLLRYSVFNLAIKE